MRSAPQFALRLEHDLIELDLRPVITHRYHYTEFEQAFAVMLSGKSGKVVLDWSK